MKDAQWKRAVGQSTLKQSDAVDQWGKRGLTHGTGAVDYLYFKKSRSHLLFCEVEYKDIYKS